MILIWGRRPRVLWRWLRRNYKGWFDRFSKWCSEKVGAPGFFLFNFVACIIGMLVPAFYEFFIALISVVTYLIAILIQASQNRQEKALHAKLDELIRVNEKARNSLIGSEERTAP